MNKEEFNIDQELEQMRQDYAQLKERYGKQQIVNDDMMQKAMKSDVRRLFLSKNMTPYVIPIIILGVLLCYVLKVELWQTLALIIGGILSIIGISWAYKGVRKEDIYNGNILSTAKTLRQFKKRYVILEAGVCIYFFLFVIAAVIQMTATTFNTVLMWRRGIIIAILCIGTLAMEFFSAKRILKSCDDIIVRLKMQENDQ